MAPEGTKAKHKVKTGQLFALVLTFKAKRRCLFGFFYGIKWRVSGFLGLSAEYISSWVLVFFFILSSSLWKHPNVDKTFYKLSDYLWRKLEGKMEKQSRAAALKRNTALLWAALCSRQQWRLPDAAGGRRDHQRITKIRLDCVSLKKEVSFKHY